MTEGSGEQGQTLAAMDIGSNAMRLTVAVAEYPGGGSAGEERTEPPRFREVDYLREPVRLGTGAFREGRLGEADLAAAEEAFARFGERLRRHDPAGVRAVATSAVREAENGAALVRRARERAGVELEVIDGAEEARLVWVAVRARLRPEGRWLLVDLGGGSLEVSVVGEAGLERTATHPVGTVRILERLGGADQDAGAEADRLLDGIEAELDIPGADRVRGVMATGGNIEELADLAGRPRDDQGAARLSLHDLTATLDRLEPLSFDERMERFDLRPDRADVIVPAGRVYRRVAELAGASEIVVPNLGVADGILLELAGHGQDR